MRNALVALAVATTLVTALACSPKKNPGNGPIGSITVFVTAPAGVTPDILLTGPDGFSMPIVSTTTIDVATGNYTLTAHDVTKPGVSVATIYEVVPPSTNQITVDADQHPAATVTYLRRPGSGRVWVANGQSLQGLDLSGAALPVVTFVSSSLQLTAVAADATGGLWVGASTTGTAGLLHFPVAALGTGGSGFYAIALTTSNQNIAPRKLAFDGAGTLWVADPANNRIVGFSAAQLSAGGAVVPAHSLLSPTTSFPNDMAFDPNGNLWISDLAGSSLVRMSAAKLATGGTQAADVVVSDSSGALGFPRSVAVDTAGNLWAGAGNQTLVEYGPGVTAASGSPSPSHVFHPAGVGTAYRLTFDASGELWVTDPVAGQLSIFPASLLASTALGVAPSSVVGALPGAQGMSFDPSN